MFLQKQFTNRLFCKNLNCIKKSKIVVEIFPFFYQITVTDVDECSTGFHNCHDRNAECKNIPGSYTCRCKHGYHSKNGVCTGKDLHALWPKMVPEFFPLDNFIEIELVVNSLGLFPASLLLVRKYVFSV